MEFLSEVGNEYIFIRLIPPAPSGGCCIFCTFIVALSDDTGVTSISSVLPVLSKMMTGNKIKSDFNLLPCLRLEKEASGALLLAKRAEVVERLLDLQRNHQVEMTYWYGLI